MHYFILFAPRFLEWPLALMGAIREQDPDARFSGLVTDNLQLLQRVKNDAPCDFVHLDHLDSLERSWISQDVSDDDLTELRAWSTQDLQRMVIGDRHVGAGYVTASNLPQSPLLLHCRTSAGIQQYLVGLCRWLDERFGSDDAPDVALLYAIASSHQVGVARACQKYNIPLRVLTATKVAGGISLSADPCMHNERVVAVMQQGMRAPAILELHMPAARSYLEEFRSELPAVPYEEGLRQQHLAKLNIASILRELLASNLRWLRSLRAAEKPSLRKPPPYQLSLHKALIMWRGRALVNNKSLFAGFDSVKAGSYMYFPLHVDPEAATMVKSPMHTNQAAVIGALAKAVPPGMTLVVKEHLIMLGKRPVSFYDELRAIPNVVIMSPFVSGPMLTRNAAAIATISGTTGLEALLLGIPLLLIADSEYEYVNQGLVRCSDPAQMPAAIEHLLQLPPAEDEVLLRYLAAAMAASLPMRYADVWGEVSTESVAARPEGLRALAQGLFAAARRNTTDRYGPLTDYVLDYAPGAE